MFESSSRTHGGFKRSRLVVTPIIMTIIAFTALSGAVVAQEARRSRSSIQDVLRWSRNQLALQSPNNAPTIDGTNDLYDADESADPDTSLDDSNSGVTAEIPDDQDSTRSAAQVTIPDDITPAELVRVLRLLESRVNGNLELIRNNQVLVRQLRSQINSLTDNLQADLAAQREILQQQQQMIASHSDVINSVTRDQGAGQRVLELSGNMSLGSRFVDDVDQAIQQRRPDRGSLIVRNTLPYDQIVVVNDQQHTVVAGATLRLDVPIGNVVTRIPGGQTYSWFVGEPQYEIHIRLVE